MKRSAIAVILALVAVLSSPAGTPRALACTKVATIKLNCERKHRPEGRPRSPHRDEAAERTLLERTNRARLEAGLPPLRLNPAAASVARRHSRRMESTGRLRHNPRLNSPETRRELGYPRSLGENVGYGPSATQVHRAFMASRSHRANVLGRFDAVGIGVIRDGSTIWVTQVFTAGGSARTTAPSAAAGRTRRSGGVAHDDPLARAATRLFDLGSPALGARTSGTPTPSGLPWVPMGLSIVGIAAPGVTRRASRRLRDAR